MLLSGFYHHNLRMMPRFYVLGLGDPLCGNGFGMMEHFVTDLIVVQTIDKLFWYFHERLQWKLSLFGRISTFHQSNTAGKATAREQFMYGYMRSLRERI